jgi:multiple sugar transport system ATP-binding protein
LTLGVRPEALQAQAQGELSGRAEVVERLGERTLVHVLLDDGTLVVAEAHRDSTVSVGEAMHLQISPRHVHLFDAAGTAHHTA